MRSSRIRGVTPVRRYARRVPYVQETFTAEEAELLSHFVTNLDQPVFALTNLPEVVKGALFARYSRSPKSVRRLLLDEFISDREAAVAALDEVGAERAESLYERVFLEYGDDSVAQLGGVHLACEQASNVLTKVLEWGRIASYLEQSTRYIAYDRPLGDGFRYHVPAEVAGTEHEAGFRSVMDGLFETYSAAVPQLVDLFAERFPKEPGDSDWVWKSTIRAKAYDTVRGLLPAATLSNVGIYASGQAYEMALVRMQAHPLEEVRAYGDLMLTELRKVIPAFMTRVDRPDRGGRWAEHLAATRAAVADVAASLDLGEAEPVEEVTLVDWDPDAERRLAAAALYAETEVPDHQLLAAVDRMDDADVSRIIAAYVGNRTNRRHKPGRAAERSSYRFDVLSDYGAFRDLQRHRLLTIEWQRLTTRYGYETPDALGELGIDGAWHEALGRAADLYERLRADLGPDVAQYAVPFAYRIRYLMQFNAREAFHLLELRTQPAGHPAYRRVCQEMHRQIREVAGHHRLADAMSFVDYSDPDLERLEEARRAEARRG
jgi:thymidylate synthase ThyX